MNIVQPIRDKRVIEGIKSFLKGRNQRDYVLFCTGIYTGLRISDILWLRVSDVSGTHIVLREGKTNKPKMIKINIELREALNPYIKGKQPEEFLFPARSRKIKSGLRQQPLHRSTAYKMLNFAARHFNLRDIGCHTMRKTWGYHLYMHNPRNLALLMEMFNHSSETVTLRYIGITQDMADRAVDELSYA
ncbi:site-specific integrase [Paenibacillus naphthalenovorans]|uniref:site-specific integrase n=1 Tax=Paenibacillus naphthalenovorans TaxID=162209 RepID=UPI000880599E|nr:site-specific integrase [Paenibacillus naphthalenovorans]SDJ76804.1 Phage integrase family protein [Paenibacillus naphthalenovorans]